MESWLWEAQETFPHHLLSRMTPLPTSQLRTPTSHVPFHNAGKLLLSLNKMEAVKYSTDRSYPPLKCAALYFYPSLTDGLNVDIHYNFSFFHCCIHKMYSQTNFTYSPSLLLLYIPASDWKIYFNFCFLIKGEIGEMGQKVFTFAQFAIFSESLSISQVFFVWNHYINNSGWKKHCICTLPRRLCF